MDHPTLLARINDEFPTVPGEILSKTLDDLIVQGFIDPAAPPQTTAFQFKRLRAFTEVIAALNDQPSQIEHSSITPDVALSILQPHFPSHNRENLRKLAEQLLHSHTPVMVDQQTVNISFGNETTISGANISIGAVTYTISSLTIDKPQSVTQSFGDDPLLIGGNISSNIITVGDSTVYGSPISFLNNPVAPLNEAKLVFLGEGSVGKTSLVRRIVDNTFDLHEGKTSGIAIADWNPPDTDYQFHLWDFGGQELMHATHQFFLTKRTLYVLVLNGRNSAEQNRLEYWLKLIKTTSDDSPIIIVQNHAEDQPVPLDQHGLQAKYPSIHRFFRTSCLTGAGIDALKQELFEVAIQLPHVHDQIPLSWLQLKRRLRDQDRDVISYDLYQEWCRDAAIPERNDHYTLMGLLHDLGSVVCFQDDPKLSEMVVLHPEWITNGIYHVLNMPDLMTDHHGVLDCRTLPLRLDPNRYPRQTSQYLIEMMHKFQLCFPLPNTPEHVLIPELLPIEQPILDPWDQPLRFCYDYEILPSSVITRYMVRVHEHLDPTKIWRHGAIITDRETMNQARIRADHESQVIMVEINGPQATRRHLLAFIRRTFDGIHQQYQAFTVKEYVPITEGVRVLYRHLLVLEQKGKTTFIPEGLEDEYAVADLLNGIQTPAERRLQQTEAFQTILFKLKAIDEAECAYMSVDELQALMEILRKKAFHLKNHLIVLDETAIDYSKKREYERTTRHLALLREVVNLKQSYAI